MALYGRLDCSWLNRIFFFHSFHEQAEDFLFMQSFLRFSLHFVSGQEESRGGRKSSPMLTWLYVWRLQSYEIDPTRLSKSESLQRNQERLWELFMYVGPRPEWRVHVE
jgi:hypothetical protein